ncbi:MAG: hypothetical protein GOU97_00060 [Nanoarchaeota archaeon]|nr:hypothetical protein [Nanoarchaeota archaeon]
MKVEPHAKSLDEVLSSGRKLLEDLGFVLKIGFEEVLNLDKFREHVESIYDNPSEEMVGLEQGVAIAGIVFYSLESLAMTVEKEERFHEVMKDYNSFLQDFLPHVKKFSDPSKVYFLESYCSTVSSALRAARFLE